MTDLFLTLLSGYACYRWLFGYDEPSGARVVRR